MPHRMHIFDPEAADIVLGYVRERLEMAEAPLDFPGADAALQAALAGLISDAGSSVAEVMRRYDEVLSRAVISADSPRYLSFIPAAPSKAALLFDTVVSCASLQGISWLEAAGAIAAENQVLRWIADLAGLPASAGGVFVQGGTAGNLSALAVARDEGRRRLGDPRAAVRVAVSGQTHSSVHNALHLTREDMQRWAKILGKKGWLGHAWPKEFGGPGWNAVQRHLYEEECALAGAPCVVPFGPVMVAPVIRHGRGR